MASPPTPIGPSAISGHIDIGWLEDFLAVAETRNFTRAAQLRNVSQAAFSRRIQALEGWLGASLIDRSSFPTCLTPDGELFRERATEIVQQVAASRLRGPERGRRKQIGIALPHSLATGRLPGWWNAWSKEIGLTATCHVVSGDVNDIAAALMNKEVDLLICYQSAHTSITLPAEEFDHLEIGRETIAPYAATTLIKQTEALAQGPLLTALPLLTYTKSATFAHVFDAISKISPVKPTGRIAFETESTATLRAMAVAGHGVAWLPESVANEAPPGALRRVGPEDWTTELKIVAYRDRHMRAAKLAGLWSLLSSGRF